MASKKKIAAKPRDDKPPTIGDVAGAIARLLPSGDDAERARSNLVQSVVSVAVLDILLGPTAAFDQWLTETRRRQEDVRLGGTDGLYARALDGLLKVSRGEEDTALWCGHRVFAGKRPDETAKAISLEAKRLGRAKDDRGAFAAVARLALRGGFDQRKTGESELAAVNRVAKKIASANKRHRKRRKAT